MNINERVIKRIEDLILIGQEAADTDEFQLTVQFKMGVENLIDQIFDAKSVYVQTIKNLNDDEDIYRYFCEHYLGIIKAIKDDLTSDLFNVKALIEAEMFDDFLSQAEYLIDSNYYQPAAVIIGCVLEDGLRKLCFKHDIELSNRPKLDLMNSQLAKQGVISKQTQKFITAYSDLRNQAAHGKWNEFTQEDVERFIDWTRSFMERYFPSN
jgi:hypothetical protein